MKTESNELTQVSVKENKRKRKGDTELSGVNKMQQIGKEYERVPHPTLRNTFILKEKK